MTKYDNTDEKDIKVNGYWETTGKVTVDTVVKVISLKQKSV